MNKRFFFLALLVTTSLIGRAGITDSLPAYTLQQLDSRNGLSNSCVNDVFQDADNLLWIATWDGLNVYNGTGFHVFNYSTRQAGNIASGVIKKIMEDEQKRIWIATNQGVSRFDKSSGKFFNYFQDGSESGKRADILMMATDGQEVYVFDKKKNKELQVFRFFPEKDAFEEVGCLPVIGAQHVFFDEQHRLWIYSNAGTISFCEFHEGKPSQHRAFFTDSRVSGLFYTDHQLYYVTHENHLYSIDASLQGQQLVAKLPMTPLRFIKFDRGYLLVAASKGYMMLDAAFRPAQLNLPALAEKELQSMQIKNMTVGTENIIWIGTDGNGVVKVAPNNRYFEKVSPGGNLSNTAVRSFYEQDNELWVGTKGNGIMVMPYTESNTLQPELARFYRADVLGNNAVYTIVESRSKKALFIGTDGQGIQVFDRAAKRFIRWQEISGAAACGLIEFIYAIYEDTDGTLWLGSNGHGLVHVQLNQRTPGKWEVKLLEHYRYNGTDRGPFGDAVFAVVPGRDHELWLACRDGGGLNLLDKRTGRFRHFKAFQYHGGISHNDIISLYRHPGGLLWIGTSYGLNWIREEDLEAAQPVFGRLTVAEGLPSNTIHAITADGNGDIWVSTNNGLARINQISKSVVRFRESDGLQSNEFSDGAVYRNEKGLLFFGGVYGFNYFSPERIHYNGGKPGLLITALRQGARPAEENILRVLQPGEHSGEELVLARSENFLTLTVKALSFGNADKCVYAYRLDGHDKDWLMPGAEGRIEYGNLPPGDYTLQLKWSDGESGWLPVATAFSIQVKQYAWLTWPAFLLYFFIVVAAIYGIARYRRHRLEMRHKLAMEHLLRSKEEEAHEEKLNFFTNIAHELQTPLTLISAASQQTLRETTAATPVSPPGYYLSLIHSQSARLTYLLQQLMEFRRSGSGHLNIQYTQLDLSDFLTNLVELFHPLVERKNLSVDTAIEENVQVFTDKDKLEKILFNLLSNVFKHTPDREEVLVSLQLVNAGRDFQLEVANSGCTLPEGDIQRLFDNFYIADAAKGRTGNTGIGLSFTRQLVALLQGRISAVCTDGWIRFTVILPVNGAMAGETVQVFTSHRPDLPSPIIRTMVSGQDDAARQPNATEQNKKAITESLHSEKKSVLLVEDEDSIRHLLRDVLSEKYIVFEAATGSDAIWLMMKKLPDLVISDVMMPDMDGLSLCSKIKETPATCHIPFILLSARTTPEQQQEGFEAGADAYIPKPFNTAYLLVQVRKLLEYREQVQESFREAQHTDNTDALPPGRDKDFILTVGSLIEKNLHGAELSATWLEQELKMSKMTLYRRIKSVTNMTPGEFIRHHRMRKAASLLVQTDLSVQDIFYQTGFNNQSYFFREFKKQYQCSPNEYRARFRLRENEK